MHSQVKDLPQLFQAPATIRENGPLIDLSTCANHYATFSIAVMLTVFYLQYREVIDSMAKLGEANACLKQLEVALESAVLDKKNAESETALAKEKEQSLKLEIKELEAKVGISITAIVFGFSP